jgi:hypothetical protein
MHLEFKRNLGNIDRIVRIVLGILLLYFAFFTSLNTSFISPFMGVIGSVMLIEGAVGY